MLNRQYVLVHNYDDQRHVPSPSVTSYRGIKEIQVTENGILKNLQNTNPRIATGPDSIPVITLQSYFSSYSGADQNTSLKEGTLSEN